MEMKISADQFFLMALISSMDHTHQAEDHNDLALNHMKTQHNSARKWSYDSLVKA